jgi:hypothetical protein
MHVNSFHEMVGFSAHTEYPTRIFDWGMMNPFGRNSPTLFQMGFLTNIEWEFLQNGHNGENILKSNLCLMDFSSYGKNNPVGFFLPWDFSWDS